jgi:pSer/pThr/pTyr-binding forkhead associated (FHA) protein
MIDSQPSPSTQQMEALLMHHPTPGLHFQLPETPLSQTNPLIIGRQAGAHLLIDEGSVSRRHAVISYINQHYMVQDLGSTNGTFVNNERIDLARPCIIQPNDILRFGNIVTCKFLLRSSNLGSQTSIADNKSSAQRFDKSTAHLNQIEQERPVLNLDGSLSSPGIIQPVPASVVATFKEIPALIILPPSSDGANSTPPWVYLLKSGRLIGIGRERGNAIELSDPIVSRRHAELFLASNGCYIRDLRSSNGVIINQVRIEGSHRLSHGDRIKLGETLIFFVDLQAGHEQTEKYLASDLPLAKYNEQKIASIYHGTVRTPLTSQLEAGTSTSYLANLDNGAGRTSLASNSASGGSTSRLADPYNGTAQGSPTRRITTVVTSERKVAVVICPHCGIANTQVARFCASCSTPLIP